MKSESSQMATENCSVILHGLGSICVRFVLGRGQLVAGGIPKCG